MRPLPMKSTASAIRPGLRDNRQLSDSPHTPPRFHSSTYSSPGSGFRHEEDAVIIDLNSRALCAGFEGESGPQRKVGFGPDHSRRVGDYRIWLPDYKRTNIKLEDAARAHELWRNDLKDVDLGLLEDKVERAVREVYNKYLLTDAGTARLVLVLPSVVPLSVTSSILTTLFERWRFPTITLLPNPTMCTVSAGVRSALVVDIGWEETVVTPISEYRELATYRSTRGMKKLTLSMGDKLSSLTAMHETDRQTLRLDFDFIEDFISRVATCQDEDASATPVAETLQHLSVRESPDEHATDAILIEWPTYTSSHTTSIPRHEVSQLVRDCFFDRRDNAPHDDHENTLDQILFRCLLHLPPDIRGICMSRIIFTGSGAAIPGLKGSVLARLETLIVDHGWTAVRGQRIKATRSGLSEIARSRVAPPDARHNVSTPADKDYVEEKLQKQRSKDGQPTLQGSLRCIDTLGSWAGASLVTSLKVKSVVEIERERFLSQGVSGATRETEPSVTSQLMNSFGVGVTKSNDRSSWTLGGWG